MIGGSDKVGHPAEILPSAIISGYPFVLDFTTPFAAHKISLQNPSARIVVAAG